MYIKKSRLVCIVLVTVIITAILTFCYLNPFGMENAVQFIKFSKITKTIDEMYYEDVDILHRHFSVNRHGVLCVGSELRYGAEDRPRCNLHVVPFDGLAGVRQLGSELNGTVQIDEKRCLLQSRFNPFQMSQTWLHMAFFKFDSQE